MQLPSCFGCGNNLLHGGSPFHSLGEFDPKFIAIQMLSHFSVAYIVSNPGWSAFKSPKGKRIKKIGRTIQDRSGN
jgi:hypothetical protein